MGTSTRRHDPSRCSELPPAPAIVAALLACGACGPASIGRCIERGRHAPGRSGSSISRSAMTVAPRFIIWRAKSRRARRSPSAAPMAPASRRCSKRSPGCSRRSAGVSIAAASRRATSPICRSSSRSTAPSRSMCAISSPWARCARVGLFGRARTRPSARGSAAALETRRTRRHRGSRTIETLSGGQMQRALFARLIVQDQRGHSARRALRRDRRGDDRRSFGLDRAMARRRAHRRRRSARTRPRPPRLSRTRCCSPASRSSGARRATPCAKTISSRARAMSEAFDERARECLRDEFEPKIAACSLTSSSRLSSIMNSCAARLSARWRSRFRARRSASS